MDISVIVPVYNDPEGINTTLDALTSQQVDAKIKYEITVVDNDSSDETPEVIENYEAKYPKLITCLVEDSVQSSYAARNAGLDYATGDILAFVDADVYVESNWIQDVNEYMNKTSADYVGCEIRLMSESNTPGIVGKYNELTGFPVKQYIRERNFAPTAGLLIRSSVIDEVGGFDPNLVSGGDKVFGNVVADAGFELGYCDEFVVYHPTRVSTIEMLKKAVRIGRGKTQIARYYPAYSIQGGVFGFRNYLPPNPQEMKRHTEKRKNVRITEFIIIYLFGVVYKYARLLGMWSEYLTLKRNHSV